DDNKHKSKKSGDSDDQSDQSRKKDKERSIKYITAYPDLLLSFNYFDQTQCGYIFEKDIEELFFCLGLRLSRSQIRKLTEKFITRDSLYYRKITDRQADLAVINPYENVTEDQLALLAQGNKSLNETSKNKNAETVSKTNCHIVM
ncbi:putative Cell cycle and apoptosis regulator protein 2, partial [Polypedilum vanderplanki]